VSLGELAPLQAALRVLRSGSADGMHEFDDLATGKAWAEAVENLDRAVLDFVTTRKPRKSSKPITKNTGPGKGKSRPSDDPHDLRNLEDARDLHQQLRERGLTPMNIFATGKNAGAD
jgi:hypothetical protein